MPTFLHWKWCWNIPCALYMEGSLERVEDGFLRWINLRQLILVKIFLKNKNNFYAKNHCEIHVNTILVCALCSIKYSVIHTKCHILIGLLSLVILSVKTHINSKSYWNWFKIISEKNVNKLKNINTIDSLGEKQTEVVHKKINRECDIFWAS